MQVRKKLTQSEKFRWLIFDWYLTKPTFNKHLLVKKSKKYNPARKMVKKSGKSCIFSICLSRVGHIIDWHCSTLIYTWNIGRQYFNYLPNSNQTFLPLNFDSKNSTTKPFLRIIKMDNMWKKKIVSWLDK